jgi:TRAP-type C4-dicarboxylate transport system permease small subunit
MLLTIADVVLRLSGRPIVGTYELVAMSGAVAIGASLPLTSWMRGHIYVDALLTRLPPPARAALNIVTRAMVLALFSVVGWNLVKYAIDLAKSGEVSPTLRLPFWPIVLGVSAGCFVQCVVALSDVARILRGEYE